MQSDDAANASRSSSRSSSRKPKTVGGFIADDSDDEDEATPDPTTSTLHIPATTTPNRAISPSPLHKFITQEDMDQSQERETVKSELLDLPVNLSVASIPSMTAPVVQPHVTVAAQPKARLPHDKLGILEDRIKEDPRGDLDAWLALISEHRSRNKLDDARTVYERALKLFPQAVCLLLATIYGFKLTKNRQNFGSHTQKWRSKTTIFLLLKTYSVDPS